MVGFVNFSEYFSATSCLDLDECQVNEDVCRNGKCENVVGSFNCICDDGYSGMVHLQIVY